MATTNISSRLENQIRIRISFFIAALVVSGLTAFPMESELRLGLTLFDRWNLENDLTRWVNEVYQGVHATNRDYKFISYGTDWLGFAHLVIAIAFIGPLKDPVRNRWVVEFGMVSCLAVLPFAFMAGGLRGIPFFWRIIDCSFGIFGALLLWNIYTKITVLEKSYGTYETND
jgi:hypothetical protein